MARRTFDQLRALALSGGGMRLNTTGYTYSELRSIVSSSSKHKATIILTDLTGIPFDELRGIASSSPGCVIFEL